MSLGFVSAVSILFFVLLGTTGQTMAQVSEYLFYTEYPTSVTITRCEQTAVGPIVIPAVINGKPVTELADYAFSRCAEVTSVDIQAPITNIGPQTFYTCWKLQSVTLPPTLRSIESEAFFYCEKLGQITIPNKVTFIGDNAFAYCVSLKTVTFPASLKTLGDYAFLTCQNLKKATFLGNAPGPGNYFFNEAGPGFKIYYVEGKKGFSSPTWRGFPCRKLSPEIAIFQPTKISLKDGKTTKSFGTAKVVGSGITKTFTIRNTGNLALSGLSISRSGKQAKDFIVTAPQKTVIEPGQSVKFKVTFKPRGKGTREAFIQIKSTDRDESPFDIGLTGVGSAK